MEHETAQRVWAAGAYAGYSTPPKLAKALGTSVDTLKRTVRGKRAFREPFESEEQFLYLVSEVCGVPYEFFLVDFKRLPELLGEPPLLTYRQLPDRDIVGSGDASAAERADRIREAIKILTEFAEQAEEEAATAAGESGKQPPVGEAGEIPAEYEPDQESPPGSQDDAADTDA